MPAACRSSGGVPGVWATPRKSGICAARSERVPGVFIRRIRRIPSPSDCRAILRKVFQGSIPETEISRADGPRSLDGLAQLARICRAGAATSRASRSVAPCLWARARIQPTRADLLKEALLTQASMFIGLAMGVKANLGLIENFGGISESASSLNDSSRLRAPGLVARIMT
jgi:hypothetical protein